MSINWVIEQRESVSSTQDVVRQAALKGQEEGFVCQAIKQERGHGRHGREWVSPPGNLYMSILLRPQKPVSDIGQLSLLSALAVGQAITPYFSGWVLKWPNDVLIEGKKISGLLLERLQDGAIVLGMGINVSNAPEGAVCLDDLLGHKIDLDQFRDEVLEQLLLLYQQWYLKDFSAIKARWIENTCAYGTPVQVKIGANIARGAFDGIDDIGSLLLKTADGTLKTITAGDVFF